MRVFLYRRAYALVRFQNPQNHGADIILQRSDRFEYRKEDRVSLHNAKSGDEMSTVLHTPGEVQTSSALHIHDFPVHMRALLYVRGSQDESMRGRYRPPEFLEPGRRLLRLAKL